MVTTNTLYIEKKTGIWIRIGKQQDRGFTFSRWYSYIICCCMA